MLKGNARQLAVSPPASQICSISYQDSPRKTVKCLMEQMQVLTHLLKHELELMRTVPPLGNVSLHACLNKKGYFTISSDNTDF